MKKVGQASADRVEVIREAQKLHLIKGPVFARKKLGISKATYCRYLKVDLSKIE